MSNEMAGSPFELHESENLLAPDLNRSDSGVHRRTPDLGERYCDAAAARCICEHQRGSPTFVSSPTAAQKARASRLVTDVVDQS